jgi:4'-phosphopantetheinyl transferase
MEFFPEQWNHSIIDLKLSREVIHIWIASLEQSNCKVQNLSKLLSEDEQDRSMKFCFEKDRKHFIVGRGLLRTFLGRYLDKEPTQLKFYYSQYGKPALDGTVEGNVLNFNLSHSHGLALYAFALDHQIGIDIELIRFIPDVEQIVERFFSTNERSLFRTLSPEQKQIAFFKGWTSKEAYLKATGNGLAYPLDQIEVSLNPKDPPGLLKIVDNADASTQWSLYALQPAPNYIATLAVEGQGWHLKGWQWSE